MIIAYVAVVSKWWNLSGWAALIHHMASLEILLPKHHPWEFVELLWEGSVQTYTAREVPRREVPSQKGRSHEELDWDGGTGLAAPLMEITTEVPCNR